MIQLRARILARMIAFSFAFGPPLSGIVSGVITYLGIRGSTGAERNAALWGSFIALFFIIAAMILWYEISLKLIELAREEIQTQKPDEQDKDDDTGLPPEWRELQIITHNETGTEGSFFPWGNRSQIISVAEMIRRGQYVLSSRQMADVFSPAEWREFRKCCEEYGWVEVAQNKRGAKTYTLNMKGKREILQMAYSPTPGRTGVLHGL